MESRRRKKKSRSHKAAVSSHLPHDILRFNIFPRLSFKSLARFKSVSKKWHTLISKNSIFAAVQSLHPSPASSGFVYLGSSGSLEFLSTPDTPIGVPQPSLSIPFHSYRLNLLASTNGLLACNIRVLGLNLFYREVYPSFKLIYVLNPATKEAHLIPAPGGFSFGLAFDPSNSPRCYTLVCLHHRLFVDEEYNKKPYWFHVFSSDTSEWVVSSQTALDDGLKSHLPTAVVFAGGVLYWDCRRYLIWFDPSRDLAGRMPLPKKPSRASQHEIGVWEGRVLTCTLIRNEKVEVFVMENGNSGNWVRRHRTSFEAMFRRNPEVFTKFCHSMRLRSKSLLDRLLSQWHLRPLALDGGDKLYIGLSPMVWKSNEKERVLCYDLRTGEMTSISDGVRFARFENRVFSYHNSMVRLPRLGWQR